jgi:putative aldouronate transport system permease protein
MVRSIQQADASVARAVGRRVRRELSRNRMLYIMALPLALYFLLFHYGPMYGVILAFKDYRVGAGIAQSPWVGLKHFITYFESPFFFRTLRNTLLISVYSILFGFPAPILLALLLNEVKSRPFKRVVQTITYLPHFISTVVICGIIIDFFGRRGVATQLISVVSGARARNLLLQPEYFRSIYIGVDIWQGIGWGSIVYLSALTAIDLEQYEAAVIDGAGRLSQAIHITLPGITPTIVTMLLLRLGARHVGGIREDHPVVQSQYL